MNLLQFAALVTSVALLLLVSSLSAGYSSLSWLYVKQESTGIDRGLSCPMLSPPSVTSRAGAETTTAGDSVKLFSLDALLEHLKARAHTPAFPDFIINIGAGLEGDDPVSGSAFLHRFHGVSVDQKQAQVSMPLVRKMVASITPGNAVALMDEAKAPRDVSLLKIDIDTCDCQVVEALLAGQRIRPLVVLMEANPNFPPPILFCERFDPKRVWKTPVAYYGCSLEYQARMLAKYGFFLFQYEFDKSGSNTVFLHVSLQHAFPERPSSSKLWWNKGNYRYLMWPPFVPKGQTVAPLWRNAPVTTVAMLREWFEETDTEHLFWRVLGNLTLYQRERELVRRFLLQVGEHCVML
jgi:hypothetical protein